MVDLLLHHLLPAPGLWLVFLAYRRQNLPQTACYHQQLLYRLLWHLFHVPHPFPPSSVYQAKVRLDPPSVPLTTLLSSLSYLAASAWTAAPCWRVSQFVLRHLLHASNYLITPTLWTFAALAVLASCSRFSAHWRSLPPVHRACPHWLGLGLSRPGRGLRVAGPFSAQYYRQTRAQTNPPRFPRLPLGHCLHLLQMSLPMTCSPQRRSTLCLHPLLPNWIPCFRSPYRQYRVASHFYCCHLLPPLPSQIYLHLFPLQIP